MRAKKYPKTIKRYGFTLVEMLVVVSIIALAATYFSNFFINRLTYEEVRTVANDMLTLNRAVTSYYSEYYQWPGFDGSDPDRPECGSVSVFNDLQPEFVEGYTPGNFEFDCSEPTKVVITRKFLSEEYAEILSGYLPLASWAQAAPQGGEDEEERYEVSYIVLRPRLPLNVHFFEQPVNNDGIAEIAFPENCDPDHAAISVAPNQVCGPGDPDPTDPVNYSLLGGYRVDIEEERGGSCDTDGVENCWKVTLLARSDSFTGPNYKVIHQCASGDTREIKFRGMVFCERE